MRYYDFKDRLALSDSFESEIAAILTDRIPGCHAVRRANRASDRTGVDYWALRHQARPLAIDVKVRDEDWSQRGCDDLALETWSVIDEKVGWARDATKRTDYVLWYWTDTKRFVLLPFPPLCCVFCLNWQSWKRQFRVVRQNSGQWQSECVFVPRKIVIEHITQWMMGRLGH